MSSPAAPRRSGGVLGRLTLTHWIFISMVVGVLVGMAFPNAAPGAPKPIFEAASLRILSTIFLRMIKLLIVPLIFSTLVVGIAGHGDDMKRVGKLALRSIIYFEIVTTLALVIGLAAVNIIRPGVGVNISNGSAALGNDLAQTHVTILGVIEHIVPQSFFEAAATNEVLQIVFFSVLFGVALARTSKAQKLTMLAFCESLSEIMFKLTDLVMMFAPFGIGGAIAVTVGASGIGILSHLGLLIITLYVALVVFIVCVLIPVALLARIPLGKFWRAVKQPWLIAFSTASSEAALPRAFEAMEEFGVPRRIVAFVLPTGYSFNLDGSTLYLAVASVFIAQAAGIDMSLKSQLLMMVTLMLTSKGVAAVPRASLVILSGALAQFGLPLEGVAVILGVDAVMDMARTSINLVGNCLATAVMDRWETVRGER
ncbi:MAG TPA: dicarboxylate/amino acid:cation symporter [Gemmatimonadaceae bacterium]